MARPLPLSCRSTGPEPIRLDAARRRPAPRLPVAMLVRSIALIGGLGLPVAAAALADLAHPAPALSRLR
ncbi:hypothetical protein SAMN04487843_10844 [Methylobacterium sp. ap11]|uniref:hypothetical protein n=1 Tax=Methylobacterium sp. ap11 TaxID=1761799 RepID=UPI0008CFDFA3|nr:hypothetical protein [Methylobacterium sp. ap11]SEP19062.1 hypothetical protein SAMN04487843_10844 [Methylobacterium sp. ap11]